MKSHELNGDSAGRDVAQQLDAQLDDEGQRPEGAGQPSLPRLRPPECVAYISQIITLEPGDVILTGTPGGIGAGRKPPIFLRPGQVVHTSIESLGQLENRCVVASPLAR